MHSAIQHPFAQPGAELSQEHLDCPGQPIAPSKPGPGPVAGLHIINIITLSLATSFKLVLLHAETLTGSCSKQVLGPAAHNTNSLLAMLLHFLNVTQRRRQSEHAAEVPALRSPFDQVLEGLTIGHQTVSRLIKPATQLGNRLNLILTL